MLDHFRRTYLATTQARKGYVRAGLERLESRCLLSLAPAAGESFTGPDWLQPIQSDNGAIVGGGYSFEPTDPGIDLGDFPDSHEYPEEPSWVPDEPSSGDEQGPSDPGGLIDIGDLDDTGPDTLGDPASKREELAVVEMLASLNYRPGEGIAGSTNLAEDDLADFAGGAPPVVGSATSGRAVSKADPEGGMVEIEADEVVAEFVADENPPLNQRGSLLNVSVQIDNAYGRFQAFEVSTTEEIPASEVSPDASGARVQPEQSSGAAESGLADRELAASESLPGGTPGGSLHDPEESAANEILSAESNQDDDGLSGTTAAAVLMTAAGVLAIRVRVEKDKSWLAGRLGLALAACRGLACYIADALWPTARAARRG